MKARRIFAALGGAIVAGSVVMAGTVIWVATAGPGMLARDEPPAWALPALVLDAVTRVLALVL